MDVTDKNYKPPPNPQELETKAEKAIRYRSIRIAQLAMFIFATGFSIILTGTISKSST